MSLQPRSIPDIPNLTAKVARRVFRKGNLYMQMRDVLGTFFTANLYPGTNGSATPSRAYDYTYDLAGNRLSESLSLNGAAPTVASNTYNAANQITNSGFTYDANGNLTSDGVNSYTWDRTNRLLSMGNRVRQSIGVNVTQYLLDLQPSLAVVLAETQGANTIRYIHGPTGIHAHKDSTNNWDWLVQDGLGSVRGVVNNSIDVLESRLYEPYGVPFGATGTSQTIYGFTGEPTDPNGLLHLRARYYSPNLGVFPSLDPFEGTIQQPMSLNSYSWVEGNTPNVIDPSGLWGERPEQWGDCVPSDDCYCYEGQNNLNAFLCRIGEIPTCTDVYAGTVDMSPRQMAVRAILRYLQDVYGAFPNPSVWNPENMDCEKNTRSSRGLEDFILLSNEVATRTNNNLDDYLYVMNSIILRYPTSGDMSVVASVAYSRSWARGFCLGAGGLSREYDDGSPNQISTHIWSFIATTASPMSSIGWVTGNIGNIIHDPLQSIVGRILTSLGRPNDIAEGTSGSVVVSDAIY